MDSKWRVYYEDGSVWNWTDGSDGPAYGVLCILQDRTRYQIVFASKYYMFVEGEWLSASENDLVDYLVEGRLISKLLVGRMTSNKVFRETYNRAKRDKDHENL